MKSGNSLYFVAILTPEVSVSLAHSSLFDVHSLPSNVSSITQAEHASSPMFYAELA
jgi:hypothetical protein